MKKILYILLFTCMTFAAYATDLQALVKEGNAHYEKGKYELAITAYEQALSGAQESPQVYFNLGNAHYKLRHIAPAIFNYEKALLLDPGNKEYITNLSYAQKMTLDDIKELPAVGFASLIERTLERAHYDEWAWFGIISLFLMLGAFIVYYWSDASLFKRTFFVLFSLFLIGGIGCISAAYKAKDLDDKNTSAIIFAQELQVKTEPNTNAEEAFTLHEGTKITLLENHNSWYKISISDGKTGWIKDQDIKKLK